MTIDYKDQDYAPWLDIEYFYQTLSTGLAGRVQESTLKTMANSCALIYAMKMRDFSAGLASQPDGKAIVMDGFIKNIIKYIGESGESEADWLELFVAGHDSASIERDQSRNKKHDQTQEHEYYTDDEYVRLAALEFMRANSNDITKQQQLVSQLTTLQQNRALQRALRLQLRLKRTNWLDRLIDYFIKGERKGLEYLPGMRQPKKRRFITFPSIFSMIGSALSAVMRFAGAGSSLSLLETYLQKSHSIARRRPDREQNTQRDQEQEQVKQVEKQHTQEQVKIKQIEKQQEVELARKQHIALDRELEDVKLNLIERKQQKTQAKAQDQGHNPVVSGVGLGEAVLSDVFKMSMKLAAHAVGAMTKPENTPSTDKVASTTHQQRVLEKVGSGGGGRGI